MNWCLCICIGLRSAFPMAATVKGKLIGSTNGTVVGDVELVAGKRGLALHINGTDQYVDFDYQSNTCLGYFVLCIHGWVMVLWVRMETQSIYEHVIMDTGAKANQGVKVFWMYMDICAFFNKGTNEWSLCGEIATVEVWTHIVMAWRPCYGVKSYFGGNLVDADTTPIEKSDPVTGAARLVLGADPSNKVAYGVTIDELRIWDVVMSDDEVFALYTDDEGLNWANHRLCCVYWQYNSKRYW